MPIRSMLESDVRKQRPEPIESITRSPVTSSCWFRANPDVALIVSAAILQPRPDRWTAIHGHRPGVAANKVILTAERIVNDRFGAETKIPFCGLTPSSCRSDAPRTNATAFTGDDPA
jgi:hypothetical protein